jgi:D-glycero-D-manno-heptose 1,7-bisphosphate phosphatase
LLEHDVSDLASPAEASSQMTNLARGFAQAGNRYPLFGIMLYALLGRGVQCQDWRSMAWATQHLMDGVGLWADIRGDRPGEPGPILFLDRDGVLIEDRGYVGSAADTHVYPDAVAAVAAARALGYRVAVVTNQSGIGRGLYDWAGFAAVQQEIDAALSRAGVGLDAVFACAYHDAGAPPYAAADHPWRKPQPGMILEGLRRLNGVAARSALVGDKPTDIAAARSARLGTAVLIARGGSPGAAPADAVVRSLGDAVAFLRAPRGR